MAAPLGRVQVILSGFTGSPGLMQFYWNGAAPGAFTNADATAATAAVRTMLAAITAAFPASAGMQVQSAVEVIEATTGALISIAASTPVAVVTGTGGGDTNVATGPLIQWFTGTVVGRRLLRGRTFLTPSAGTAINSGGSVQTSLQTTILAATATYIASAPAQPVIWHRPVPYATGTNGVAGVITAAQVPVKVAVLRSRRD